MGRHHALKLPHHLYPSRPPPPPPTFTFALASSLLSANSAVSFYSPASLIQETGRTTAAAIPGFKASAAFLSTLRANLTLDPSVPNTPDLRPTMASSTGSLPPPSPLPPSSREPPEDLVPSGDPLSGIPSLTTTPATSEDDKVEALHLLADSVAQQRQVASSAMIYHPFTLAAATLCLAVAYRAVYKGSRSDWILVGTTGIGVFMVVLLAIRWLTQGYLEHAEKIGTWKWLEDGADSGMDEILLTRFGDEVIGAIIIRPIRDPTSSPRKGRKGNFKGIIRGWTVKRKYRGKGVGEGLLEDAVALCVDKGWSGPEFAKDHAHSARFLPVQFQAGFDKREVKARESLEKVKEQSGVRTGPRKGKR